MVRILYSKGHSSLWTVTLLDFRFKIFAKASTLSQFLDIKSKKRFTSMTHFLVRNLVFSFENQINVGEGK